MHALRYYGGKVLGTGEWIAGMLPYRKGYVEPFAGMLGVLLKRRPCELEMVNDLNGYITNWWEVVRDRPEDLVDMLAMTPDSEIQFNKVKETDWELMDEVWRAWALTVVLVQGMSAKPVRTQAYYGRRFSHGGIRNESICERIMMLRGRIVNLAVYNMDAIEMLDRLAKYEDHVIYCDPPYATTRNAAYGCDVDKDEFIKVLKKQKSIVGVSGYEGDWDELGWVYDTRTRKSKVDSFRSAERVEAFYRNFDVQGKLF